MPRAKKLNNGKDKEVKVKTSSEEKPKEILEKEIPKETPRGRQENYFFPKEMRTIRASSLEEATKKLKEKK